jgi:hypothetical protein
MAYVEIGSGNGGLLLNLSEGGLAVQAAHVFREARLAVRFRLPEVPAEIDAVAEVVWLGAADKRAGLRFLELSPAARKAIQEWVAETTGSPILREREPERNRVRAGVERRTTSAFDSQQTTTSSDSASALLEQARQLILSRTAGLGHVPNATEPERQARVGRPAESRNGSNQWSPRDQPQSKPSQASNVAQDEVKLPEIAWWVEPQPRRKGWGAAIGWVLAVGLTLAIAASLGWWQPAKLERLAWEKIVQALSLSNGSQQPAPPQEQGQPAREPSHPKDSAEPDRVSVPPSNEQPNQTNAGQGAIAPLPPPDEAASDESAPTSAGAPQPKGRESKGHFEAAYPPKKRPATVPLAAGRETYPTSANTVLVRPPDPGSLPVILSLPEKTVAATAVAAITSRRGVKIPPALSRQAALLPERVSVGRLLAASANFELSGFEMPQSAIVVEVQAKIGLGGEVEQVKVLSGPPRLAAIVQQGVRQWRYEPSLVHGQPVESEDSLRVIFRAR